MSSGGADREAGFGNLPKWPDEAKELPDARNRGLLVLALSAPWRACC
jgi:hypothetical protein